MTTYARLTAAGEVERLIELTPEQFAELQANGKAAWLRIWIVDAKPVPGPTQLVVDGPVVITATEAHQTWVLRDKTQAELDLEQRAADQITLTQMVASITTDIDAYNPTPDMTGTVAQVLVKVDARLKELERQQRRDNRILRHYLKGLA